MESFSFESVNQFLQAVGQDQAADKQQAMDCISDVLKQDNAIAVPLVLGEMLDKFFDKYGDAPLKAISLYVLSMWIDVHTSVIKDNCSEGEIDNAMLATSDMTKLSTAFVLMQQVGIFGEDDEWTNLILKQSAEKLVNDCKNKGIKVGDYLKSIKEEE